MSGRPQSLITLFFQIGCIALVILSVLIYEGDTRTLTIVLQLGMVVLALADRVLPNPDPLPQSRFGRTLDIFTVALVAWIGLQVLPLPTSWVAALSSHTLVLPAQFTDEPAAATTPLSLYPLATWRCFWQFACYGLLFIVVRNRLSRTAAIVPVAIGLCGFSVVIAAIAVFQSLTADNSFYWFYTRSNNAYGPFANHNRFAGFSNLCLGLAIGWLLYALLNRLQKKRHYNDTGASEVLYPALQLAVSVVAIAILAAAVALSLSRGGTISLVAATGVVAAIMLARPSLRKVLPLFAVPVVLAVLVIYFIGHQAVRDRMATLNNDWETLHASVLRFAQWQDSLATIEDFPVTGIGAGSYRYIHPHYNTVNIQMYFSHVENEYLQLLVETGVVGFLLLLSILTWMLVLAIRVCRGGGLLSGWWIGLCFSVTSMAVHSLGDFGPHRPSVGVLFVIVVGMWVGYALRSLTKEDSAPVARAVAPVWHRWIGIGTTCAFAAFFACGSAIAELHSAAHWREFERGLSAETPDQEQAKEALAILPADVDRQLGLAKVEYEQLGKKLLDSYQVRLSTDDEQWRAAERRLIDVRRICPVFHFTHEHLANLHFLALGEGDPAVHLSRAARANPRYAPVHRRIASLAMTEARWLDAISSTHTALALDHGSLKKSMNKALLCGATPETLIKLIPEDPDLKLEAADYFRKYHIGEQHESQLLQAALDGWRERLESYPNHRWLMIKLARTHRRLDQPTESLPYYQRLLQLEYANVGWRYEYANSLREVGKLKDALYQAKLCLRLKPKWEPARNLLEELADAVARSKTVSRILKVEGGFRV